MHYFDFKCVDAMCHVCLPRTPGYSKCTLLGAWSCQDSYFLSVPSNTILNKPAILSNVDKTEGHVPKVRVLLLDTCVAPSMKQNGLVSPHHKWVLHLLDCLSLDTPCNIFIGYSIPS